MDTVEKKSMKPLKESIDNQSIVLQTKAATYVDIADFVQLHVMEKSSKETTEETLKVGSYCY